jgi:hypothetical protein
MKTEKAQMSRKSKGVQTQKKSSGKMPEGTTLHLHYNGIIEKSIDSSQVIIIKEGEWGGGAT